MGQTEYLNIGTDIEYIKEFSDSVADSIDNHFDMNVIDYDSNKNDSISSIQESINNLTVDKELIIDCKIIANRWTARKKISEDYFTNTQRWLGHIENIDGNIIYARLIDLVNGGTEETAEFDMKEVSHEDKKLVRIGAGFYWSVGYAYENRQISKKSLIRFQRLIELSNEDVDEALDRSADIRKNIVWD